MNISHTLHHHAATRADHPALIRGEERVTYGELDALVSQTSRHLGELGLERGEVVGVRAI